MNPLSGTPAGWNEYAKLVLAELNRHNDMLKEILEKQNTFLRDYALLKHDTDMLLTQIQDHERRVLQLELDRQIHKEIGADKERGWSSKERTLAMIYTVAAIVSTSILIYAKVRNHG